MTDSPPISELFQRWPDLHAKIFKCDKKKRRGPIVRGVVKAHVPSLWQHTGDVWLAVKHFPWEALGFTKEDERWAELMAFCHDFVTETHGVDYTPHDKISPEQKNRKERVWKEKFVGSLGPGGEFIGEIWEEYQAKATPIAKIVGLIDKLVAVDEAWRVEWSKPKMKRKAEPFLAQEFFDNVGLILKDPFMKWIKDKMELQYRAGHSPDGLLHKLLQSHNEFLQEQMLTHARQKKQHIDQAFFSTMGPAKVPFVTAHL